MEPIRIGLASVCTVALLVVACGGGKTAPQATSTTIAPSVTSQSSRPTATLVPSATVTPSLVSTGEITVALLNMAPFELLMSNGTLRTYLDALYDYVINTDSSGKLDPQSGWATSWSVSADGTVHTFKGRDSILFQNGGRATAQDVKAGMDRMMADGYLGTGGPLLRTTVASTSVPDEQTLTVSLKGPNVLWHVRSLSRIGAGAAPSYLISGKHFAAVGEGAYNKSPVASGPYKVASVAVGDRITYEALDKHWYLGTPRVKRLTFAHVPEFNTRIALLKSGSADLVMVNRQVVSQVQGQPGLSVFSREGSAVGSYTINEQGKQSYPGYGPNPLADVRVRKAMDWYAVDRPAIVATFLKGLGKPTMNNPVTDADPAYEPLPIPQYDPGKAKTLLADAGYVNGFAFDFWISAHILPEALEIGEALAVYWENIGLKVNRKPVEYNTYRNTALKGWDKPTVFGFFFGGKNTTAGAGIESAHKPNTLGVNNTDPELDRLATSWSTALNEKEYIERGRAYSRTAYEQVTTTALFEAGDILAGNAKIPKTYSLGKGLYSYQVELAAALR